MPTISVITPVLNAERFIRQTVESVLGQRGDFELEYIVRDGGSTDGTLAILEEYRDHCRIVSEPDGSPQAAINAGMAAASGDILCWLNADDLYRPGTLQRVADTFANHPDKLWCYGRCSIIDEAGREIRKPITWYKNLLGFVYSRNWLLCENVISQPATFWRRELWERCGGLDTSLKAAFDYKLWLQLSERSPAAPIHATLADFRRHACSISENHTRQQFDEELALAKAAGNHLHYGLHWLNRAKILAAYHLLNH